MPPRERRACECDSLPRNPPSLLVERKNLPLVFRQIVERLHITIQPRSKRVIARFADGSCHEHTIAPDYRARISKPWYGSLPFDIPSSGDIPVGDCTLTVAIAGAGLSSERGPVSRCCARWGDC